MEAINSLWCKWHSLVPSEYQARPSKASYLGVLLCTCNLAASPSEHNSIPSGQAEWACLSLESLPPLPSPEAKNLAAPVGAEVPKAGQ